MPDNRWPRPDPRDPGVPHDQQDRKLHPVPRPRLRDRALPIFGDMLSPRDLIYNR